MVVVGEDCALTSKDKTTGRRGLCGTVLIHKVIQDLYSSLLGDHERITQQTHGVFF